MGWFSHISSRGMRKKASAQDIANNALQLLNNGLHPSVVSTIFTNQMRNPNALAGVTDLRTHLQNIVGPAAAPQSPANDASIPGMQQPEEINGIPGMQPEEINGIPGMQQEEVEAIPGMQDDFEPMQNDFEPLQENAEPESGDIPEEAFEVPEGDFEPLQEDDMPDITPEPVTPVQRVIEEDQTAVAIEEVDEEVPDTERSDEFEDMTLELDADDMAGVEEVKHIEQRSFSIPTTFKTKNDNLKKLVNRINKINQYKDSKGQSPMAVRFMTQDGSPSGEPVIYQKEITNPNNGESFFADYVDFVLEGEPPNPLGNPVKETRNPDGTVSYEEVVYQIIGSIQIVPVAGFEPKEEKFKTKPEAIQFANMMNEQDPSRPYEVGKKNRSQIFKELYPETQGLFYPATYIGKWRTIVDHYPNTPSWKQEYKEGNPLDCDHCGTKKRGQSSRRSVYVAIEYPAAQLITENGKPRDPLPEEMMAGKQVWIGTKCVQGQKGALQFISDLTKLKEEAMGAEKEGRASDSFGGSMRSPKGIVPIMAHYFAAGKHRPGKGGNWYKRRWGEGLSPQDFKEFKKYFFGLKRSAMRKAAIELHEYEKSVEEYPEKLREHEQAMAIYPYLMEEWRREGSVPEAKPEKPKPPKAPKATPPPGPKPLPWGEASEEDTKKASDIIEYWKEKANDPTIDYNDLVVNESLGASGEKMHNMISIALGGKVDGSFFDYIPDMIDGYERDMRRKQRETDDAAFRQEQGFGQSRSLPQEQSPAPETITPPEIQQPERAVEPVAEPVAEPTPQRNEPVAQPRVIPEGMQDIRTVAEGDDFRSMISFVGNEEKTTARGRTVDPYYKVNFTDDDGKNYYTFNKTPFEAAPGQAIGVKGKMGPERRYRGETSTQLYNLKSLEEAAPEIAPEITPEAEPTPEVTPEVPAAREPVENTILGDEEKQKKLERIGNIANYAANVVETGRTRDTQDEWGNPIPGREMSPQELIPLYVEQVAKVWPAFDEQEFANKLNSSFAQYGKQGLLNQIKLIPTFARNLL